MFASHISDKIPGARNAERSSHLFQIFSFLSCNEVVLSAPDMSARGETALLTAEANVFWMPASKSSKQLGDVSAYFIAAKTCYCWPLVDKSNIEPPIHHTSTPVIILSMY